jgi:hypothetical protein
VEDPDETFEVAPDHCARCERSLADAAETGRVRPQVVDVDAPPPPKVTEYQLVSRRCGGCGQVNDPTASDVPRPLTDPGTDEPGTEVQRRVSAADQAGAPEPATTEPVAESATAPARSGVGPRSRDGVGVASGQPGPDRSQTTALAALLTCGHYLPVGRAASVLDALAGIRVSTGFISGVRRSATQRLEGEFLPHLQPCYRPHRWCTPMRPPGGPPGR